MIKNNLKRYLDYLKGIKGGVCIITPVREQSDFKTIPDTNMLYSILAGTIDDFLDRFV